MRVSCLGPTGTFSEEALLLATAGRELELVPGPTIFDAVMAVETGEVDLAFVPFENSIEGSVRPTLDALAFDTERARIIGEYDHPIRASLIGAAGLELGAIATVLTHPQAAAQCARFLREELPDAEVRPVASTSEAVQLAARGDGSVAALGSAGAAERYGAAVLREGVEDFPGNVTRFVWLATSAPEGSGGSDQWRTTLVFWELGEDHPGALVDALTELSRRGVNMTRIESRPRREGLGRYLFFIDIDGPVDGDSVADAVAALRTQAETVRLLGSYPVTDRPPF